MTTRDTKAAVAVAAVVEEVSIETIETIIIPTTMKKQTVLQIQQ